MSTTPATDAVRADFEAWYARMRAPVMMAIDRSVCGCDYGGTSWTTRAEADRIAASLSLAPGKLLLDIGAGAGWPGLYLATLTGCAVVLVDLPQEGLRLARERADTDGLGQRCRIVQGDAAALPLENASVDAISHSDVLCCLPDKIGVLSECRRVIRPAGRMIFAVIHITPGLPAPDHAEAVAAGPPFVETEDDYQTLLVRAGWRVDGSDDITATFAESIDAMCRAREAHREQLRALLGTEACEQLIARDKEKARVVRQGALRRTLFAVAPTAQPQ